MHITNEHAGAHTLTPPFQPAADSAIGKILAYLKAAGVTVKRPPFLSQEYRDKRAVVVVFDKHLTIMRTQIDAAVDALKINDIGYIAKGSKPDPHSEAGAPKSYLTAIAFFSTDNRKSASDM